MIRSVINRTASSSATYHEGRHKTLGLNYNKNIIKVKFYRLDRTFRTNHSSFRALLSKMQLAQH